MTAVGVLLTATVPVLAWLGSAWPLLATVVLVAATPGFYELKRTRTQGPDFS